MLALTFDQCTVVKLCACYPHSYLGLGRVLSVLILLVGTSVSLRLQARYSKNINKELEQHFFFDTMMVIFVL